MNGVPDIASIKVLSDLRHRLALGLECRDAVSGLTALGPQRVELERIGPFATPGMTLQAHGVARHALPWAGRVRSLMTSAVDRGEPPAWVVRIHSTPAGSWDARRDLRRLVPRRLRLLPVLTGGVPATGLDNARVCALVPGAAYPLFGAVTAVRGRVMHDATTPMPWAFVLATRPASETDLAAAIVVGRARADDRGEYLLVLSGQAVAGATLPSSAALRLWAFAPATPPDIAGADPLASLPLEDAGTATNSPLLRGEVVPATYTRSVSQTIAVRLSTVASGPAATLTLP